MVNSIQQFQTNGTKELTKIFNAYVEDPTKVAEMVYGVTDVVIGLGLSLIGEEWESYDELLWKRKDLRPDWSVIRRDEGKKITGDFDSMEGRDLIAKTIPDIHIPMVFSGILVPPESEVTSEMWDELRAEAGLSDDKLPGDEESNTDFTDEDLDKLRDLLAGKNAT